MPDPLVSYDSSSDSETEVPAVGVQTKRAEPESAEAAPPPSKRRRGLPKLPMSFSTANPKDDPAQHQGRTRSRPFVDGDYNAHIYISLPLPAALRRAIENIIAQARGLCPGYTIHSLVSTSTSADTKGAQSETPLSQSGPTGNGASTPTSSPDLALHISLTHPLPLRHSQLITFRDNVRAALCRTPVSTSAGGLRLSLAGDVVGFVNGRKYGAEGQGGRAFLALRVTAGSKEIERLVVNAIHPILARLHLPLYHSNPQFHASFAWTLIDPLGPSQADDPDDIEDVSDSGSAGHTPFNPDVLAEISRKFGKALIDAQPRGGWEVQHLELKIGKEIHRLPLT